MKHFLQIAPAAKPITYDTPHSVTLTLSDWQQLKTDLFFHAFNADQRGAKATAERIRAFSDMLCQQIDDVLEAAEEHESMEAAE